MRLKNAMIKPLSRAAFANQRPPRPAAYKLTAYVIASPNISNESASNELEWAITAAVNCAKKTILLIINTHISTRFFCKFSGSILQQSPIFFSKK